MCIRDRREAYAAYKAKGFEIYAVSLDNDEAKWRSFTSANDMPWINVLGIDADKRSTAAAAYGITSIPANFLISPDGIITVSYTHLTIRRLGIRLRRLEAVANTVTATSVDLRTPVRDTVVLLRRDTLRIRDTLKLFRWRDAWVTVEGRIRTDSVACRVQSTDTLRQVVHRVPRRFLFIRWGTKALRQEIVSSNRCV